MFYDEDFNFVKIICDEIYIHSFFFLDRKEDINVYFVNNIIELELKRINENRFFNNISVIEAKYNFKGKKMKCYFLRSSFAYYIVSKLSSENSYITFYRRSIRSIENLNFKGGNFSMNDIRDKRIEMFSFIN